MGEDVGQFAEVAAMTAVEQRDHFTLPEQRFKDEVRFGGISTWHVMEYRTEASSRHPGRWTRRAAGRRTLCGALRALVIGLDASDWPTERVAPDLSRVTCARCLSRAKRVYSPGLPPAADPTQADAGTEGER